jgi:uncharacterized membrane protein YeaQ/YmgE (transglycosylase-associated protein family)
MAGGAALGRDPPVLPDCNHLECHAFLVLRTSQRRHSMVGVGWILAIIIGGIAGWIAEKVMHSDMGLLMNIILGIVGAVIGNFILMLIFGATMGGIIGQLIVAVIGACLLIWIVRAIRGTRHTHA